MPYKDPEKRRVNQIIYQKRHYQKKKQYYKDKAKKQKKGIRDWYYELKSKSKCIRCGENHPACLDFHHVDPEKKEMIISLMPSRGISKKKILKEIEKCVVLCANCHRKEHFYKNKTQINPCQMPLGKV